MILLTKEILRQLPPLGASEHVEDPTVIVKFFDPCGSWTWYGIEYDPIKRLMWGLVDGHAVEAGYWDMNEIESVRNRMGLGIERDTSFRPCPLSEVRKKMEAGR